MISPCKSQFIGACVLLVESQFGSGERPRVGLQSGRGFTSKPIKSRLPCIKYSLIYRQFLVFFVFGLGEKLLLLEQQ